MSNVNCWEYMNCGHGPGNSNSTKSGICPVATDKKAAGLNDGINGGRICWIIAEDSPSDAIKCSELHHKSSCFSCEFRYKVTVDAGLLEVCNAAGEYLSTITHKSKPAPEYNEDIELLTMARKNTG
ncbi:MAG: hypothetical protein ISR96_05485 [Nitrospira sp.]|nr:hypothetical protein [bacterium]MBL7048951.1 hypothetical protein [Nitrospira sp.]